MLGAGRKNICVCFALALLMIASFGFASEESIPLDQLRGDRILSAASNQQTIFILMSRYQRGGLPVVFKYLYDFETNLVREVDDPRLKSTFAVQLAVREQGFYMVAPFLSRVYLLDKDGAYLETVHLDSFHGYRADHQLSYVMAHKTNLFIGKYQKRGEERQTLVLIDMNASLITTLYQAVDEEPLFWLPAKNGFYELRPRSGTVKRRNGQNFQLEKTLFDLKSKHRYRGRTAFAFATPIVTTEVISLHQNIYFDERGKELSKPRHKAILVSRSEDKYHLGMKYLVVGHDGLDQSLAYDLDEMIFFRTTIPPLKWISAGFIEPEVQ